MSDIQLYIYFLSPDVRKATGGVKIIYKHVDILNKYGFNASVVHSKNGFRARWFENKTRVQYIDSVKFKPNDIVVIPEYMAFYFTKIKRMPKWKLKIKQLFSNSRVKYFIGEIAELPVHKVMYNQNTYMTFLNYPYEKNNWEMPYLRSDVIRTITVSIDNTNNLKYIFPDHKIERVHLSFDLETFSYTEKKKPQICFMPRKNREDARQVINILQAKGLLDEFELKSIHGKSEQEVAQILKESLIFMSFGSPEGSPLPPCEAMLCGCIVVGYHGWGGREYFKPEFCYPVEVGDILMFAKQMEQVIQLYRQYPEQLQQKGKVGSDFVKEYFSKERETQDVLRIWNSIRDEVRQKTS